MEAGGGGGGDRRGGRRRRQNVDAELDRRSRPMVATEGGPSPP